jgi:hypothetical protein
MSGQILSFPRQQAIVSQLKAAEAELQRVVEEEEDGEAASDLWGVIERLQEVIIKISGPL